MNVRGDVLTVVRDGVFAYQSRSGEYDYWEDEVAVETRDEVLAVIREAFTSDEAIDAMVRVGRGQGAWRDDPNLDSLRQIVFRVD